MSSSMRWRNGTARLEEAVAAYRDALKEYTRERVPLDWAMTQRNAEHSETQKKLISELESQLDLNQREVRAVLDILGERDVPPERLAAKLVEIAERFKALEAMRLAQPGEDAKVAALKAERQKAIEAGDLAKADALLADVESAQRRMIDSRPAPLLRRQSPSRTPYLWEQTQRNLERALSFLEERKR